MLIHFLKRYFVYHIEFNMTMNDDLLKIEDEYYNIFNIYNIFEDDEQKVVGLIF